MKNNALNESPFAIDFAEKVTFVAYFEQAIKIKLSTSSLLTT